MPRKALIKIRRGTEAQLPTLDVGELGFCTDTNKLYIGTSTGNQLLVAAQSVGDMLKSIYDTNNDGIVDNADKLDGKHASSFVLKTGDTMSGDLKVAGNVIAANKLAVGFNNVDAERFRFEYNGSTGRLELWVNSSDSDTWVKKVEFPKRQDDNDFSLLLGGNQVWHAGNFDPNTKLNKGPLTWNHLKGVI